MGIIIVRARRVWVWKGQPRQKINMRSMVEEIGKKVKARVKASLARAEAKRSTARKACMQSMEETRPDGVRRPIGPKKDGPRRMSTPEQLTTKMMR